MNHSEQKYDVIVVGGGPAGMMAAGIARDNGSRVLLIEKNHKLGEKLAITGGGRCNITNATYDSREFLKIYNEKAKYFFSTFDQFDVQNTFDFFESRGLPLVVEARKRAFPKTQKATDVRDVMVDYCTDPLITKLTRCSVQGFAKSRDTVTSVITNKGTYTADSYIIACGGVSHPETGSTGDGFTWMRELGHTVADPTPSIVPLATKEKWNHELSGVSLSFMRIIFYVEGKRAFAEKGKILFTHFGISGPLILNSAHKVTDLLYEGEVTATIDCYPDTDHGALEKKILHIFDMYKNKSFKNVVAEIVPEGMKDIFDHFDGVPQPDDKVHSITKEERKRMVQLLKALPLTITDLMGMDRAVIADGGVALDEIDTKTMRSKKYDNLYIIGDMLHINRPSGGYSLQLCWTTGYVAGLLQ